MGNNMAALWWSAPLPILGRPALLIARELLGGAGCKRFNLWWKAQFNHLAADSCGIYEGCSIDHSIPYGPQPHETLDHIRPKIAKDGSVAAYFPGGGFVTSNCRTLNHCMTPLARAGQLRHREK